MFYNLKNIYQLKAAEVRFKNLCEQGKQIELKEIKQKRTLDQNALFHAWIKVFAECIGELSIEDCKRDVKRTLLGVKQVTNYFTGEIMFEDYKTSAMDTKQMAEFMDKFKIWANAEYGCYLPYFNDAGYEEMINNYK